MSITRSYLFVPTVVFALVLSGCGWFSMPKKDPTSASTSNGGTPNGADPANQICAGLVGGTWVAVPGDSIYGTTNFCVQKYTPSNVNNLPTSQPATLAWVNISQDEARTACSSLGAGYHLITNPEWMTIAANVANVASNWSDGAVGNGQLAVGNTDFLGIPCAADPNDANGWLDLRELWQKRCKTKEDSTKGSIASRRTFNLSNNLVIWDMAGNFWQWVDWYDNVGVNKEIDPYPDWCHVESRKCHEYTDSSVFPGAAPTAPRSMFVPVNAAQSWWSDSWNSKQGIGTLDAGGAIGAVARGGAWDSKLAPGLFAAKTGFSKTFSNVPNTGFRCAWHP